MNFNFNLGKFLLWNPESWDLEYGLQLKESKIPLKIGLESGIQVQQKMKLEFSIWIHNPRSGIQVPLKKIWSLVTGIRNPARGIQTSKNVLHFLSWADQLACSAGQDVRKMSWIKLSSHTIFKCSTGSQFRGVSRSLVDQWFI